MFGKEIALPDSLINTLMTGKKATLIMFGICTARVVEKSPMIYYFLVMRL